MRFAPKTIYQCSNAEKSSTIGAEEQELGMAGCLCNFK